MGNHPEVQRIPAGQSFCSYTQSAKLGAVELVYKRSHPTGRHKIQDSWDPIVYVLVQIMDEAGRVCKVRPRDGTGPEKNLNRVELKVFPLTIIPTTLVQPLPDPGLIKTPPSTVVF